MGVKKQITFVKGARQAGKSTWIVKNAPLNALVISCNHHMSQLLQQRYIDEAHEQRQLGKQIWFERRFNRLEWSGHINALTEFRNWSTEWGSTSVRGIIIEDYSCIVIDDISEVKNSDLAMFKFMYMHAKTRPILVATFTPRPIAPLPKSNWFWFMQGLENSADFIDLGLPRIEDKHKQELKEVLPEIRFKTEILGEWVLAEDYETES